MKRPAATVQHNFWLTIEEEKRFAYAVVKNYGTTYGVVAKAIKDAVMRWVEEVERKT